jgi:hypothetical protein
VPQVFYCVVFCLENKEQVSVFLGLLAVGDAVQAVGKNLGEPNPMTPFLNGGARV